MKPLNATEFRAAIMLLHQQEMTMLKHEIVKDAAPEVLTEEQFELISGGLVDNGTGNIPICPPWSPGPGRPVPNPLPGIPSPVPIPLPGLHVGDTL